MNTYKYRLDGVTRDNAARILKFNAPIFVALAMVVFMPFVIGLAIRPGTYMVEAGFGAFIVLVVFVIQRMKKVNALKGLNQVNWDDETITFQSADGSKHSGSIKNISIVEMTKDAIYLYLLDAGRKKAPTPIAIAISKNEGADTNGAEIVALMQKIVGLD